MMESHGIYEDTEYSHMTLSWGCAILSNPPQKSIETLATGP